MEREWDGALFGGLGFWLMGWRGLGQRLSRYLTLHRGVMRLV